MKCLPGSVWMADMILSKWSRSKSNNQCPLKRAGFSLNSTINTIDEQAVGS